MEKNKRSADIFFQLTRRHLLVFFKNKMRVLYTLLVPVIIFVVYIFFLRSLELTMAYSIVNERLQELGMGVADETLKGLIGTLVDTWMLSGITALSTITVSLQTNTVFVEDKQSGVNRDFISSPIHRNLLICSYFLCNFIVTALICIIFLVICFLYLACMGEFALTLLNVLTIFAVLIYTTVSATLMTVFICSFVKTEATMAGLMALFSTAIGFLIGAYMPLGSLPPVVQNFCGFIPGTYSCSLLRYSFMTTPLANLNDYVVNVMRLEGGAELIAEVTQTFGFDLQFFGTAVGPQWQTFAVAVFIVIFLLLNIGFGKKIAAVLGIGKKKKKQRKS